MSTQAQPFPRPELTLEERQQIAIIPSQIFRSKGLKGLQMYLLAIISENMILTKEVNQHREARGFELLKIHEPKV